MNGLILTIGGFILTVFSVLPFEGHMPPEMAVGVGLIFMGLESFAETLLMDSSNGQD